MTREEHMAWCKERALAYLPDDPVNAIASMLDDLTKHEETADHIGIQLTGMLLMSGLLQGADAVRKHIEGFS
jgi:hypothetical protein